MRHAVLLIVLALTVYAVLRAIGTENRAAVWRAVRPHILPVTVIVAVVLLALVMMFYTSGINIL